MKILIEDSKGEHRVTIETLDDTNIHDMMDNIERLLIAHGFHCDTVKEGFLEKAEEREVTNGEKK